MIKIEDNLIIDKLDYVDVDNMLEEQRHIYYEDKTIHSVKVVYNCLSNFSYEIKFERFIHILTEKSLVTYFLSSLKTGDFLKCIAVYTDDGCGIFSDKAKDMYNLYMMSYSHDDASDGLTNDEIEQLINELTN